MLKKYSIISILLIVIISFKSGPVINQEYLCLLEVDFSNKKNIDTWRQKCDNYGALSGNNVILNSTGIECLFNIEKKYNNLINTECYYLYNNNESRYLYDLEFGNKMEIKRSKNCIKELNEVLELYKTFVLNDDGYKIKKTPLLGSKYSWRSR